MTMTEEMILEEARTRFEERGVQYQFGCRNMNQAIQMYNHSCLLCSMSHDCKGAACTIQKAFLYNTEKYKEEIKNNPLLKQSVEFALELG